MKVLIVRNHEKPEAMEAAFSLAAFLDAQGCAWEMMDSSQFFGLEERNALHAQLRGPLDLTVVLGGDGTIIRTASVVRGACPILGINFGHLGFLANDSDEGVISLVSQALCDELHLSRRACLDVRAATDQGEMSFFAVNEVCISRGATGRTLEFSFGVSDVPMAQLKGDGLIVSTATGSTGYSLAAGGPLVTPGFTGMVVQPLAPHTLLSRALLANANDVVEVSLTRDEDRTAAMVFIDGDAAAISEPLMDVRVQRAEEDITLLYSQSDHFLKYSAEKFFGE